MGVLLFSCAGRRRQTDAPSTTTLSPQCDEATRLKNGGQYLAMPDGMRVWYKLSGLSGAPVVAYLHGGPGYNALAFEKSAGHLLEEKLRVLYVDQRGCGRSGFDGGPAAYGMRKTVEDIDRIRSAIGAGSMALIGHSFGGIVAAEYVRRFPKTVTATILVDTTPAIGQALAHQIEFVDSIANDAFPGKARAIHAIAQVREPPIARLQRLYELIGRLPLQRRVHFASPAMQDAMEAIDTASGIMGCTSDGLRPSFEREGYLGESPGVVLPLPVPTLLIAGRSSEVIGKDNIERSAESWGARVQWFEGAGHFVYFEKPREFADAVAGFLAACLVRSGPLPVHRQVQPQWRP